MSCDYIYSLASGIWEEIGEPVSISIPYISGWLTNDSNLGKLNNLINVCYSGVSGCIEPPLGSDESAIYKEIYKDNYYKRQVSNSLNSAGSAAGAWVELKDGTSSIKRHAKTDIAKIFVALQAESAAAIKDMASSYNINRANPLGVDMGSNTEDVYKNYENNLDRG